LILKFLMCCCAVANMKYIVNLSSQNFSSTTSRGDWFILFYAHWCGHCKRVMPTIARLARHLNQEHSPVKVARLDCIEEPQVCVAFDVKGYPTLKMKMEDGDVYEYIHKREIEPMKEFIYSKNPQRVGAQGPRSDINAESSQKTEL